VVIGALNQQGINIAFTEWMILALPLVFIALFLAWIVLTQFFKTNETRIDIDMSGSFNTSKNALLLYVIFGITVFLWITEKFHGMKSAIIALIPVVFLTLTKVTSKDDIRKLPWEVLWLVAGGLSLGISMKSTGLAEWIIGSIAWGSFGPIMIILIFGLVCYLIANFLSHTVTATLIVPLAVSLGTSAIPMEGFNFVIISIVVGVSASLAMMLPISTPPNAIAMSTGTIETSQMAKAGITIGVISLILVFMNALFYWPLIIN
jgi:sodium-dependent dicarboxylate transporter 2/3/5